MAYKNPEDKKRYQKIYNKMYREKNRQYFREAHNKWSKANPDRQKERRSKYLSTPLNRKKSRARSAVYYALKMGRLIRPDHCERCETPCKPEADHHDYDKPLDVNWLCKVCHIGITMQRKSDILRL